MASGSGCTGSGGANTLTASTLPWIGATLRARGSGLQNLALVLALTSITSAPAGSVPLTSLFAAGVPGCDVLVLPDGIEVLVAGNGMTEWQLVLPSTPALVGVTFFHQMIPIEVDAQLAFLQVTTTNALQLTIGTW